MSKPWLAQYPEGVPAEIQTDNQRTLASLIEDSCREFADTPAYSSMGNELSYTEIEARSRQFAAYLQHELGFVKGDRIALMMPNLLQYPIALFGVLRAGMVAVNVNPLYTARELEHQLVDSDVRAIVIVENFAATLEQVIDKAPLDTVITTRIGDCLPHIKRTVVNFTVEYIKRMVPAFNLPGAIGFNNALSAGAKHKMRPAEITPDDIAFLQYTGGTTGPAKGATLTHRNLVANVAQAQAWLAPWTERGHELIITALPLYHVFALMANCLLFFQLGGKNVLVTDPRDMPTLVKTFDKHRPTAFTGVNTLFNALVNNDDFAKLDFSRLRITLGGGAAVQKTVAEKWQEITHVPLIEAYGLTEASPAVAINPMNLASYNGSIGLPIPSTDISIRDYSGHEVAPGETGELCVAGPQVMTSYWQQPEETDKTFFPGGYLRTGDIARFDEQGFLYIVDRKKDMILVSGFNVYPNEVEDVMTAHPKVLEAACVGVSDDKSGEAVKVFVVRRDNSLTEDELIDFCHTELTGYKIPKHIVFMEELPKSNVGKILRRKLRNPS